MNPNPADSIPDDPLDLPEDDGVDPEPRHLHSPTVLPPRRTPAERHESVARATGSPHSNVGLRIESHIVRRNPLPSDVEGLDVKELSSSVVRLEQAHAPPKIARIPVNHEKPAPTEEQESEQDGEDAEWGHQSKPGKRWILASGIAVAALVIIALVLLPAINRPNTAREKSAAQTYSPVEEETVAGVDALNRLIQRQPEAEKIFRTYATTRIFDELLPVLRDSATISELARKKWRPMDVPLDWTVPLDSAWRVAPLGKNFSAVLEGALPDFKTFCAYFVVTDNHLLLDWKATTAYSTASFDQLASGHGDPSEVRGTLAVANFYTATWPEKDFQSFQFIAPGGETYLWCYVRRGTYQEAAISKFFQTSEIIEEAQTSKKATLRLEHDRDGSAPNQWAVADLLHIDWISP